VVMTKVLAMWRARVDSIRAVDSRRQESEDNGIKVRVGGKRVGGKKWSRTTVRGPYDVLK
jgi:hypothetical protein